jgi:predicted CXXCH cytochrome family protein
MIFPSPSRLIGILLAGVMAVLGVSMAQAQEQQSFAGSATCTACHAGETKAWERSDHFWALREPDTKSVLGDFNNASFTHKGVTTRFTMEDGQYWVETDGPDGKLTRYKLRYTVGVRPLQQYLVETEGDRLQALDIVWDVGERKWMHLYPDGDVGAGNGLHWTGTYKNWQGRCAECHQTGFDKGFDFQARVYKSHWAELTVSCESCHGPSASHVESARKGKAASVLPPVTRLGPGEQANELAVCGPCHARREAFSQMSSPAGSPLGDHYNLALLNPPLYFPDGQQRDEVFILGSFLQSKMSARGVTCSNCHEPHGGELVAEGNAVCTQCHNEVGRAEFPTLKPKLYDSAEHHHHQPGSEGAQCASCHMPATTYMQIDKRRDHFFRRPDPAQSKQAGSPDVCTGCHEDKSQDWAAGQIAQWFPRFDRSWQDRSALIDFGNGNGSAAQALAAYVTDLSRPAIVRATGLAMLAQSADPALKQQLSPLMNDRSDLVRTAAAPLARDGDPAKRAELLKPLLNDPVRAVRQSAATELVSSDPALFSAEEAAAMQKALGEYLASRQANADMPEAHMALAGTALGMRNWDAAEAGFKHAVELDPQLEQGWVMLARLRTALGDAQGGSSYIAQGLEKVPAGTELMFEKANALARSGDNAGAMDWYRKLLAIDPARADAWMQLASAALRAADGKTAIEAAGRLAALEPENGDAFLISSIGRYLTGDIAGATADAKTARALSPMLRFPAEIEALLQVK